MLAVGSRDNYIYMHTVSDDGTKYSRVGRCSGHSSFVTHIDWSLDNHYLQSNSGDYELLFCEYCIINVYKIYKNTTAKERKKHTHLNLLEIALKTYADFFKNG